MKRLVENMQTDVGVYHVRSIETPDKEDFQMPYSEPTIEVRSIEEGITEFVNERGLKMSSVYVSVFNSTSFVVLSK
jgi:hypothetical protein